MSHLISFVLGIVVATVGFSGVAKLADKGVDAVRTQAIQIQK